MFALEEKRIILITDYCYKIFRNFDFLIPDAPELVHTFLEQEQDASCKRNAFMMLIHVDQVESINVTTMYKTELLQM